MAQQLKRWESPRRSGRNDKGRGGSARQRQIRKRSQGLRNRLRREPSTDNPPNSNHSHCRESQGSPFLWFPERYDSDLFPSETV
jgi:hypothetical protein